VSVAGKKNFGGKMTMPFTLLCHIFMPANFCGTAFSIHCREKYYMAYRR